MSRSAGLLDRLFDGRDVQPKIRFDTEQTVYPPHPCWQEGYRFGRRDNLGSSGLVERAIVLDGTASGSEGVTAPVHTGSVGQVDEERLPDPLRPHRGDILGSGSAARVV